MLIGDVRKALRTVPEKSIQTCVTSPPYWGLRDYGTPGQLGLEPTPEEYVANMVDVFSEVWRVLRDDGTLWLNLGDSYASDTKGSGGPSDKQLSNAGSRYETRKLEHGLKPKDLVGIPWRVAFALQADGWYLRSDIIWHKPNPMPESVTDRPTKAHEYIFLLSKSERYFYDAEAIKENVGEPTRRAKTFRNGGDYTGGNSFHNSRKKDKDSHGDGDLSMTGRNKRTVWTIATRPYPGSHFATFPPKLIEPCILAGTSPRACEVCGSPWERVVERSNLNKQNIGGKLADIKKTGFRNDGNIRMGDIATKTLGWQPTCTCDNKGQAACTVLDPFGGSGTTTMMAEKLGRNSVYIDLNPEYVELAKERCGFGRKLIDTATCEIREV